MRANLISAARSPQVAYREGIRSSVTVDSSHASAPGGADDIHLTLALHPAPGLEWAADDDEKGAARRRSDGGGGGGLDCGATAGVRERLTRRELTGALQGLDAGIPPSPCTSSIPTLHGSSVPSARPPPAGAQYGELRGYPLYGVRATLLRVARPKGVGPEALRHACADAIALAIRQAAPVRLACVLLVYEHPA